MNRTIFSAHGILAKHSSFALRIVPIESFRDEYRMVMIEFKF